MSSMFGMGVGSGSCITSSSMAKCDRDFLFEIKEWILPIHGGTIVMLV